MGPLDLLVVLRTFAQLQMSLIAALRGELGARDWRFLMDVPRRGEFKYEGDVWRYSVHGMGIRFEGPGGSVDANRGLDRFPSAFDSGRIVEYIQSQGAGNVSWRGRGHLFDYDSAPSLLRQIADAGEIARVEGDHTEDELYTVPE